MGELLKEVWLLVCKSIWLSVIEHKANKFYRLEDKCRAQCCATLQAIARYKERFNCEPLPKGE